MQIGKAGINFQDIFRVGIRAERIRETGGACIFFNKNYMLIFANPNDVNRKPHVLHPEIVPAGRRKDKKHSFIFTQGYPPAKSTRLLFGRQGEINFYFYIIDTYVVGIVDLVFRRWPVTQKKKSSHKKNN